VDLDALKRRYLAKIQASKKASDGGRAVVLAEGSYAQFLYDIGGPAEYDEAEKHFRAAIKAGPAPRRPAQSSPGELAYGTAAGADPGADTAWCLYASLFAAFLQHARQAFNESAALYLRVLKENPKDCLALGDYAALLHCGLCDYDRADAAYQRAVRAHPEHATVLGNYANFLKLVRCDMEASAAMYERAIQANPTHPDCLGNYAVLLHGQIGSPAAGAASDDRSKGEATDRARRADAAEAMYQRAIQADPLNANNLGNAALFFAEIRGDDARARALYERAVEADPHHANALYNFGVLLDSRFGDYDGAQRLYERAIAANPSHGFALHTLAVLLEDVRKDYDGAEARYRQALALGSASHTAFVGARGASAAANGEDALCLGDFANFLNRVRGSDPERSESALDEAEALYRRSVAADPSQVDVLYNFGNLLKRRGNFDGAEDMYRRTIALDARHAEALGNLGNVLADVRADIEGAEALYRRAIDADPKNAENLGNFADFLYDTKSDPDGAEALYEQALACEPRNAYNAHNFAQFLINERGDAGCIGKGADGSTQHQLNSYSKGAETTLRAFARAETLLRSALSPEETAVVADLGAAAGATFDCDCLGLLAFILWRWPEKRSAAKLVRLADGTNGDIACGELPTAAVALAPRERAEEAEQVWRAVLDMDPNHIFSLVQYSNLLKTSAHAIRKRGGGQAEAREQRRMTDLAEKLLNKARDLGALDG
jgi:tetratricopeptide (TPR) repeat protein